MEANMEWYKDAYEASTTKVMDFPADQIRPLFSDLRNIYKVIKTITSVDILGEEDIFEGVGASRRCNFKDGTSIVEKVIASDNNKLRLEVVEPSLPLYRMELEFSFVTLEDNKTKVGLKSYYLLRFGFIGQIMNTVFGMENKFVSTFESVLENANKHLLETLETVEH